MLKLYRYVWVCANVRVGAKYDCACVIMHARLCVYVCVRACVRASVCMTVCVCIQAYTYFYT